jgi:hypothetical protein
MVGWAAQPTRTQAQPTRKYNAIHSDKHVRAPCSLVLWDQKHTQVHTLKLTHPLCRHFGCLAKTGPDKYMHPCFQHTARACPDASTHRTTHVHGMHGACTNRHTCALHTWPLRQQAHSGAWHAWRPHQQTHTGAWHAWRPHQQTRPPCFVVAVAACCTIGWGSMYSHVSVVCWSASEQQRPVTGLMCSTSVKEGHTHFTPNVTWCAVCSTPTQVPPCACVIHAVRHTPAVPQGSTKLVNTSQHNSGAPDTAPNTPPRTLRKTCERRAPYTPPKPSLRRRKPEPGSPLTTV